MTATVGYERAKRGLDVVIATTLLVLATPMMLAIALTVAVAMGRPVLFRQTRPGRHGRLFVLVKFRSMHTAGAGDGPAGDAARLTPVGRWLRATSLDELPTLWNVLRGEMSLVGPRPLPAEYLERYTPEQFRRHDVRPGITGLAQINGRNALGWEEKFSYDLWYVNHRSLRVDLRILARTAITVLRRDGINAPGRATATEFLGIAEPCGTASHSTHHRGTTDTAGRADTADQRRLGRTRRRVA